MTITQHDHIYSFHTSSFNFGDFVSIFFINKAPTNHHTSNCCSAKTCTATYDWNLAQYDGGN